ncbi:MAG: gamma-glutamyltransferase family protein [Proteobacteria bacterium]|nr:MAG: gamma-glutamyltransferase family protein [Pseudomonadota bacterium]
MQLSRPEIVGTFGAVSSSHWIASQCAMRILERGGNAFDAAVAGGFVLQVVAPHLNGPAGDVAMLLHRAADRSTRSVCGQGPVPAAATIDRFRGFDLDMVPGTGLLPAVVPGAFDAWLLTLRDFGSLEVDDVLESAIHYAEHGIPVSARLNATLTAASGLFHRYWPRSREVFLPSGEVPEVDSLLRNPVLASTFRRIAAAAKAAGGDRVCRIEAARRAWSQGFVADAIDRFCREERAMDVTGREHPALLTGEDIAAWSAEIEAPAVLDYAGWTVVKCGPWSQGPAMLQSLALLDPHEVAALDPCGAEFVHRVTEAMKLAFADREVFYGDPVLGRVPMDRLLSDSYSRERRALITDRADNGWRPGPGGGAASGFDYESATRRVREGGLLSAYGGGEPTVGEVGSSDYLASVAGDTCHIDVVDEAGNLVSATPSGGWLQSSPVIPDLGFPLGTRAQMTWLDPDSPSRLQPGARPRTTLTPTLVLDREARGYLACGTPGGDQQDQWQAVFLLRHLLHGFGLQEAIEAPCFHSEHWPNSFYPRQASPGKLVLENRFDDDVFSDLSRRGHNVVENGPWSEGRLTAVARESDGRMRAAANPRGGIGYAVGR